MSVIAFLPFIAFAVLTGPLGASAALLVGAAVSVVLILRGWLRGQTPKILEIGSVVLFLAISAYIHFTAHDEPIAVVKLAVDVGLFTIVLGSLLAGTPFTLQYAREQTPPELWHDPRFLRINARITTAWAIAFAVLVLADALLAFAPGVPKTVGIVATVAAIGGASAYTLRTAAAARSRAADAGIVVGTRPSK